MINVEIPKVQPPLRGAGSPASLDEAAKLLAGAKFPVIVAGGGVIMSGGTEEAKDHRASARAAVRSLAGSIDDEADRRSFLAATRRILRSARR